MFDLKKLKFSFARPFQTLLIVSPMTLCGYGICLSSRGFYIARIKAPKQMETHFEAILTL